MELSQTQQALIYMLKTCGASKGLIIGVLLMLSKSDTATGGMVILLQRLKPKNDEQILRIAMGLAEMLPPEEQAGVIMNKKFSL